MNHRRWHRLQLWLRRPLIPVTSTRSALVVVLALSAVAVGTAFVVTAPVAAHGPDPTVGGALWAPNQALAYQWRSGQVPPDWMAAPITAAAGDVGASRASRAATFSKAAGSASSLIAYGEPTGCSTAGIACFDRSGAPNSFRMWFRAQGHAFDWGTLRWCQGLSTIANGCFDVETIALDEFGHVEGLDHHANLADGSDYLDAVVQAVSHARPAVGWQARAFGRCDTGRLQLLYDRPNPGSLFSNCLAVPTTVGLSASSSSIWVGSTVQLTATLRTTPATANGALANDPISGRSVVAQRRPVGGSTWTTIGAMGSGSTDGTYVLSISPTATYEWRAAFTPGAADGAVASSSAALTITVGGCSGAGCPSRPVP
ncbi:MAG: hypothetical protein HY264_01975 [Chloroflexi bacterium]|nr:hypothetical protein [Chloroflexota bacterium]